MLVLMAAAVLTTGTGDWADASVILLVIVVNTSAGVVQEVKADRAITALSLVSAPEARVLRDGEQCLIPAAEVVAGDVLVLAEGDIVAADARVTEAAALLLDESALTGESVPAGKVPGDGPDGLVSTGTVIVRGRGRAVVTATGEASAMGRIAALMQPRSALTPLQRRMAGVGRVLAAVAVLLCAIVLTLGLARGQPAELMIVTAISLVVAAVPESLPAVVTLALALGARRMTARRALVRRLPAVETLGSVIGTNKTGTLTEGVMVARRLWTLAGEAVITGSGYQPRGQVLRDGKQCGPAEAPDVTALLTAAALCNDAVLRPPQDGQQEWAAVGDPTEAALLAAAGKSGQPPYRLRAETPRVAEIPFDSVRKRMTIVHRLRDGGLRVICKGAPEVVLTSPLLADPAELVALARNHAEALARDGFRVLAVAAASRPAGSTPVTIADDTEQGLHLLGLIGLVDPPRRSAAATIASCQAAGITPVLITGDHPATAAAIATETGILSPGGEVVDCRESGEPARPRARVFARATPEQKSDRWGAMRLTVAGRRTGRPRSVIVGYFEDGPDLVTMAMNGWGDGEPGWWLNLQADPDAEVRLAGGGRPCPVRARAATGDERSRLWARWREIDKDLDAYAALRSTQTAVVISGRGPEPALRDVSSSPRRRQRRRRPRWRRSSHRSPGGRPWLPSLRC